MAKKVLIIVPVFNGVAEFLGDCFSSLLKINYPQDDYKILAIDDVSSDNSVEYIRKNFPEVEIIVNKKNLGFTGTNNVGLQLAIDRCYDYAFMLNQDTTVESDFLTQVVNLAETDGQIGAVQSKLLLHWDKTKINSIGNQIHFLGFAYAGGHLTPDRELTVREITYPSGAAVLLRVNALRDVGLLNQDFYMYHEDVDLGWRLWLGNWKVMLAPESVVYHKYEFSRSIQKYYFMERNRYLILCQNYKIATILLISPAALIMDLAMLIYSMINGWFFEELRVYNYFFQPKVFKQVMLTRFSVQKKRRVKDKEIVKRFIGRIDFQEISNPLLRYIGNPIFNLYWQIVKRIIWW
ncbi:MAG: glycosyltransferase family 2 protein [Candidatus Buchananbacteria bacterium]